MDNIHIYIQKTLLYKQSSIYIYLSRLMIRYPKYLQIYVIVEIKRWNHPHKCIFEEWIFRVRMYGNDETAIII